MQLGFMTLRCIMQQGVKMKILCEISMLHHAAGSQSLCCMMQRRVKSLRCMMQGGRGDLAVGSQFKKLWEAPQTFKGTTI
jgi:hypothetical protein